MSSLFNLLGKRAGAIFKRVSSWSILDVEWPWLPERERQDYRQLAALSCVTQRRIVVGLRFRFSLDVVDAPTLFCDLAHDPRRNNSYWYRAAAQALFFDLAQDLRLLTGGKSCAWPWVFPRWVGGVRLCWGIKMHRPVGGLLAGGPYVPHTIDDR